MSFLESKPTSLFCKIQDRNGGDCPAINFVGLILPKFDHNLPIAVKVEVFRGYLLFFPVNNNIKN
jgi:hypothetical protein